MKEVPFQQKYIAKIVDAAVELLNDRYQDASTIVFQAPTGSGKTYMISQALTEIVKQLNEPLAFIWISVNSLHEQSLANLSRYLEDERLLECITFEEILDNEIEQNQIVFFNWESLIKKNNVFRLDNEHDWNLKTVAENTREENRRIVLIIDESHRTAKADKAREVIEEIGPALTIEMTATPLQIAGTLIKVPLHEVIDAGMIKREVIINPFTRGSAMGTDAEILDAALKRRKQLKAGYERLAVNINPLLLVQVANAKPGRASNPEDYVLGLLADRGYSVKNGNLAVWLSEKKENKEHLELADSPVDVLIFKEAIAVGWDCPRAAILYLDREWSHERFSFNIQTLGRIMRMPEQKHYDESPDLNVGYVYSASNNFEIVQELAGDYVSSLQLLRDEDLYEKPLKLRSEFIRRRVERSSLSGDFKQVLLEAAEELKLKGNINENVKEIQRRIHTDGRVENIDVEQSVVFEGEYAFRLSAKQINDEYSDFIAMQTRPYMPKRSAKFIKSSIRSWFKEAYEDGDEDRVARVVIQGNNRPKFLKLIELAKEKYGELPTRDDEIVANDEWAIPDATTIYRSNYVELIPSEKSILKESVSGRFFAQRNAAGRPDLSGPESTFIELLEKTDDETQWWFRNGTRDSKYFSIAYKKPNGHLYGFYPDFILKTKKEVLIVEIKDNTGFTTDNFLKLRAGKDYLRRDTHTEKIRFHFLSPDDFDNFFRHVKDQELENFSSLYEERLIRWAKSSQVVLEHKAERTDEDVELLKYYEEEFAKVAADLEDTKTKKELLEIDLQQALENLEALGTVLTQDEAPQTAIVVPKPFNICVLGDVSNSDAIMRELQAYFAKRSVKTNDWSIDFFNNTKLKSSNVLKSLVKGQSKYSLIVTGQIYHHAGKGNTKSNLISELAKEKYIPHIVGVDPKSLLTPTHVLGALELFFQQ